MLLKREKYTFYFYLLTNFEWHPKEILRQKLNKRIEKTLIVSFAVDTTLVAEPSKVAVKVDISSNTLKLLTLSPTMC